jgi:uncharacterized damage-inducible protein DinB
MIASIAAIAASAPESRPPAPAQDCAPVAGPLIQTLRDLRSLLGELSGPQYSQRAGELFADSSIGGHVRHVLDHARALAEGWRVGTVDYDHRARGTSIETDIVAADAELARLIGAVEHLSRLDADDAIGVRILPSRDAQPVTLSSTLARELAFVLSHTIHHNATIRGMVLAIGERVPESFGYAASTLAHRGRCAARCEAAGSACAR